MRAVASSVAMSAAAQRFLDAEEVLDQLARRQMLIVSGKGGVGRTTIAALFGLALARRGRNVLVATVGLDDRLAWMLGQDKLAEEPTPVVRGLSIQRVVTHVCVREYGAMMIKSQRIAKAVFDNKLMRRLLNAVPGLDDYAVLGKLWHEACRARSYDTVIFDGPATGHLRYTLGVPRAILRAVPVGQLTNEAKAMRDALEDPQKVQAVLVGLPARWPLTEMAELATSLREELNISIGTTIVNGVWPGDIPQIPEPSASEDPDGAIAKMLQATNTIAAQGGRHRANVEQLLRELPKQNPPPAMVLPWAFEGLTSLPQMQAALDRFDLVGQ